MRSSSVLDYDDTIATATVNVCVSGARAPDPVLPAR